MADEEISRHTLWLCVGAVSFLLFFVKFGFVRSAPIISVTEVAEIESPTTVEKIATFARSRLDGAKTEPAAQSKIRLTIDLSDRRLYLYQADRLAGSYPVAIGQAEWETPTGTFEVIHMEKNPVWEQPINGKIVAPGEENPLGERWIGFWTDGTVHIGIHGTSDESQVGQAISHGCLRMRNSEIRRLYDLVFLGTPIEIRD
ncbi:L,D-transpeptidase [Oscillatoriales cyanobacterium LEGE 11467]|uniref:L,D-transpeptidase n=2 Tax=Zarconia TaxID=2992130 RepID=A0A928VWF9_9CYAN|nr:L,D-transpeptidase [Zarconia navalis LEGE 11467]